MKLSNNDLDFRNGSLIAKVKDSVKDVILDCYNTCVAAGADLTLPDRPLSLTKLISILKEKGLIEGHPPPPQASIQTPSPCIQSSEEELNLMAGYKEEVQL